MADRSLFSGLTCCPQVGLVQPGDYWIPKVTQTASPPGEGSAGAMHDSDIGAHMSPSTPGAVHEPDPETAQASGGRDSASEDEVPAIPPQAQEPAQVPAEQPEPDTLAAIAAPAAVLDTGQTLPQQSSMSMGIWLECSLCA